MAAVLRALFGYFFLVFMVRIVGRRPGRQMTPFEFVLIFFLGGLMLTQMVGDEESLTNALCQIITVACAHYLTVWMRCKSSRVARLFDGMPLVLLDRGQWRISTMEQQRIQDDDVMAAARDQGLETMGQIEYAVLERNGQISIIKAQEKAS
jgi:uncharacterized membrane protein YcaP (DUF421 family)